MRTGLGRRSGLASETAAAAELIIGATQGWAFVLVLVLVLILISFLNSAPAVAGEAP